MSIMLDNPTPAAALAPLACPAWRLHHAGHPAELDDTNGTRTLLAGHALGAAIIEGGR